MPSKEALKFDEENRRKNRLFRALNEAQKQQCAALAAQKGGHPYDFLDEVMVAGTKRVEPTVVGDYW